MSRRTTTTKKTSIEKRAVRDIRISQRPAVNQLQRSQVGTANAYAGLADLQAPQAGQYGAQTQDIAGNLQTQLAALSGALGGDTPVSGSMLPAGEAQAGANMGATLGAGGFESLASQAQRNLGFQQSAVREGGLAQRSALDNLTQQMNDLYAQRPDLITQRIDELKQKALENSLVKSQMSGDAAFNSYLQSLIGGMVGGGGGGGGSGGGGGGSGGGGGGGGTFSGTGNTSGSTTAGNTPTTPHYQGTPHGGHHRRRTRSRNT